MEEKELFCSVVVPVFNASQYIRKCVDSILSQQERDFELILVDDGSKDDSGEISDEYAGKDDRVRVIHQKNAGHTGARNAGVKCARGRYISFVDSDDWVEQNLLSDCKAVAEEKSPDVILFGYRTVSAEGKKEVPQRLREGYYDRGQIEKEIYPTLLTDGRFSLWQRLIKREVFLEFCEQIDRRILVGEDMACCMAAMCRAKSAWVLSGVYYDYFLRQDSVIHSYKNYSFENWHLLRSYLKRELEDLLPGFEQQLGTCSIRFLHQAVLGELARNGLCASSIRCCVRELSSQEVRRDLGCAETTHKKARAVKRFMLRHKLIRTIWMCDRLVQVLHRIRGHI